MCARACVNHEQQTIFQCTLLYSLVVVVSFALCRLFVFVCFCFCCLFVCLFVVVFFGGLLLFLMLLFFLFFFCCLLSIRSFMRFSHDTSLCFS